MTRPSCRTVFVELLPIAPHNRRSERELRRAFEEAQPGILGGLLDALAATLSELPSVELAEHPRMADYARVQAALDQATGSCALDAYLAATSRAIREGVEADPVGTAVLQFMRQRNSWEGTATALLEALSPMASVVGWPGGPNALSRRLNVLAGGLRRLGVVLERDRDPGTKTICLRRTDGQRIADGTDDDWCLIVSKFWQ